MEEEKAKMSKLPIHKYHRFLDEAGDTTFYGKGKIPVIGNEGVSTYFLLGRKSIMATSQNFMLIYFLIY